MPRCRPARRARAVGSDQDHHRLVQRQAHRLRVRGEPGRREARLRDEQRHQRGRFVERRLGGRDDRSTRSAGRPSSAFRSRSCATPTRSDAHLRLRRSGATSSASRSATAGRSITGSQARLASQLGTRRQDRRHPDRRTDSRSRRTSSRRTCRSDPLATANARDQKFSAGADIKYGITPNVTLDATVNPDFGQVEADPAVLNLSAFETFFAERRPFFVEGTGLYQFQLNCNIVNCNNEGLFYSRRIGRSPQLAISTATRARRRRRRSSARRSSRAASRAALSSACSMRSRSASIGRSAQTSSRPRTTRSCARSRISAAARAASASSSPASIAQRTAGRTICSRSDAYTGGHGLPESLRQRRYEFAGSSDASRHRRHRPRRYSRRRPIPCTTSSSPDGALHAGSHPHVAQRPRRADQVRQVRRRRHALPDVVQSRITRDSRSNDHRLSAPRRPSKLEQHIFAQLRDACPVLEFGLLQLR